LTVGSLENMASKPSKPGTVVPKFLSVAVVVSDRTKAVAWYTEKLGLERVSNEEHWQTVGRKGGSGLLHLCQVSEFDPKAPLEPGNTGIALTLSGDFVKSCAALEARGVEFVSPPTKQDWGWGATVRDPDGNEIYLAPEG
jgi:catechol 2,3-dioxygenase-like lactoylglutathione lyase family enzyme